MDEERPGEVDAAIEASPLFAEATRLFNLWLDALDALVRSRTPATGEAARQATAALFACLEAHAGAPELAPVHERLGVVFTHLREQEPGGR
jgi:hypothetical protein